MGEKKGKLYLSELFLEKLNGNYTRRALLKALRKCNKEILRRLGTHGAASEVIECCVTREGRRKEVQSHIRAELSDFSDVYSEFEDMLAPEMKEDLLILQIL